MNTNEVTTRTRAEYVGFAAALRMECGPGRRLGVSELANLAGIAVPTIKSYLRGQCAPSWANYCKLVRVCGVSLVNNTHAELHIGGAHQLAAAKQCLRDLHIDISRADAMLTELGADGIFDHQDEAKLRPVIAGVAHKAAAAGRRKVA